MQLPISFESSNFQLLKILLRNKVFDLKIFSFLFLVDKATFFENFLEITSKNKEMICKFVAEKRLF